ncbi:lipid-A-disaccharide synthase [Gloeocapsopsis crepidinum LEGE 06123]|uniref:Lipid-A-disaccharide synthase n=1 Tax=Gloeocapsopsis crepidinum LEGE 06123 TaxID=588587 RepID=A0ABR9UXX3_9CHRO|nr:lipid-A-disaccharide synthase [Gloeocapsopsis crepidinum]MBE9192853.1 lipid-A-disaccharide synthase [Gloeocapsopsis crepidinum LEGE 06123]
MSEIDILILSNGPGEITTWVRPVVKALRQQLGDNRTQVRISVILSPCPNASGKEAAIAQSYPEVDRVQAAEYFWQFLLTGKTAANWDWRKHGVVIFLGGDQFFPVVIGKRLGYRTVIYAEWDARWYRWIDRFGVMKPELISRIPTQYAHKFTVVGDLMAEASGGVWGVGYRVREHKELIGLLPGSKPAKLTQGVPLGLAIAQHIHNQKPETEFVIPVAPTLDLETLASFADPRSNPIIKDLGDVTAELMTTEERPFLKTNTGLRVELETRSPAYDLLTQCSLCLTTVGANTAELGALAVPMIVLLPTHQLDAMRSWDGIPGILANLPIVGSGMAKAINWLVLKRLGLLAWPNIWAKSEVVPELVGNLQPHVVAELALDYLNHPEKLAAMREQLRTIRGESGAAQKLATIVSKELNY